jgi:uncharacterized membrane protein YdjX (TVP38/TMEM64 family)
MKKNVAIKISALAGVFLIVVFFILLSYLVQNNIVFFESLIIGNFLGLLIYIFLNILAIVVAPITVLPLIVVVAGIWGWVVAGFVTWIAWILGSVVAFLIARRFGIPIVRRFISLDGLYKFEERFSFVGSFWGVVFLRMVIPVEILSYGLGLFGRIGFWRYTFASALGFLPIVFLFGYFGVVPFIYQVILGLLVLIGVLVLMIFSELRVRH